MNNDQKKDGDCCDNIKKYLTKDNNLKDVVCGMNAKEDIVTEYVGKKYNFCSNYCQEEFKKNPERYIVAKL